MSDESLSHGTFCWAEVGTTDAAGAKEFYTGLFDWQVSEHPMPGGGTYLMFRHQEVDVAGGFELPAELREQGVPVHWLLYVAVDDVAATAARAAELGGTVVKEPFDVGEMGTMAVLQDPTGGTFALWKARKDDGARHTDNRPNTVCWNELATRDAAVAGPFYQQLFGWRGQEMPMEGTSYTMFMNGEAQAAGMLQMTEEWGDIPSHWMMYLSVADCDASAARAAELGGNVCVPPTDIPVGRFAVLNDPQGGTFSIIKLAEGGDS